MGENILEVKHMTVSIYENGEEYKVVNRISFAVCRIFSKIISR